MTIPTALTALLFAPGIALHEWAHVLACRWFGVTVLEVAYLRFEGDSAGFVRYALPTRISHALGIGAAPLLVNPVALVVVATLAGAFGEGWPITWALMWLATAIGMGACPSRADMGAAVEVARRRHGSRSLAVRLATALEVVVAVASGVHGSFLGLGLVAASVWLLRTVSAHLLWR